MELVWGNSMKGFRKIVVIQLLILFLIIVFIDNESLNSFFINYREFKVNEVAVLPSNYNEVIYHDEYASKVTVESVQNESVNQSINQTVVSNNVSVNKVASGSWQWPVEGNYTITTYYSASHKAIDIYSYNGNGSSIYAANNGTVSLVMAGCVPGNLTCNGSGGNYVVINHHNGYYTVYMHLKSILVSQGQVVSRGQVIGTMGNTGNVIPAPTSSAPFNGTHLHFCLYQGEPYRGGYAINPMSMY